MKRFADYDSRSTEALRPPAPKVPFHWQHAFWQIHLEGDIPFPTIRNQATTLDAERAGIYGIEIRISNQAIKRNAKQFPNDLAFPLGREEFTYLKSQSVTLKLARRPTFSLPWVSTESAARTVPEPISSGKPTSINIATFGPATQTALPAETSATSPTKKTRNMPTRPHGCPSPTAKLAPQ